MKTPLPVSQAMLACAILLAAQHGSAFAQDDTQSIARAGSQPQATGPAANFSGQVKVDPLWPKNGQINASGAYVTFAPGARSAWHVHPSGQRLVVTAGSGLTQEWGKPVQQLRVGDVVWCPPGVKHWHGAAPDAQMTHLAVTGMATGKGVDWMEKVSDDQYHGR